MLVQRGFQIVLPHKLPSLVVLGGKELLLINSFKNKLKQAWEVEKGSFEVRRVYCTEKHCWGTVRQICDSYSLFATHTLIECYYNKENFDQDAKDFINWYLAKADQTTNVLIIANNITLKALDHYSATANIGYLMVKLPTPAVTEAWIMHHLKKYVVMPGVAKLIYQYTQGNLLACAQVIKKISLNYEIEQKIDIKEITSFLHDQCEYKLYELSDACLSGNTVIALQILRYLLTHQQEYLLILWSVAQEIRLLIQLDAAIRQQKLSWDMTLNKLKIWKTRSNFYKKAYARLNSQQLAKLLLHCSQIDVLIKTMQSKQALREFELLIIKFCCNNAAMP